MRGKVRDSRVGVCVLNVGGGCSISHVWHTLRLQLLLIRQAVFVQCQPDLMKARKCMDLQRDRYKYFVSTVPI